MRVFNNLAVASGKDRINGEIELKYAIAILYGPTTTDDPRRWITDAWIAFSPRKRAFALRKRDEAETGSNTNRCDLQKLQPDDWLTWQSPQEVWQLAQWFPNISCKTG